MKLYMFRTDLLLSVIRSLNTEYLFYVHVTVHRNKFLCNKTN